ncbi:LOW QUALITY PROTEIN: hypothetical protein PHMEG_0007100 [Phytophthora megakarya]|uniref:Uncharacterized protein n=1 Tax=Phytophthora megakarya TaxID=4795 RepID=A0A225WNT6_9STRA|nr:LOW QUALITY PROTEIN: hypothetical protein PHMEG_0007100 [Phytophthora megakarya]
MVPSIADHLLTQEYSRIRSAASKILPDPLVSDEDSSKKRMSVMIPPYGVFVVDNDAISFTPSSTRHAAIIEIESYCTSVPLPVIFKFFLIDHGNGAVNECLEEYGVVMVEIIPPGGMLFHVRLLEICRTSSDGFGSQLQNQKNFSFLNKFYLDVSGVHTTEDTNDLFLGLCALCAPSFFMTPLDVNLEGQVVTPTWCFYFGCEDAPPCLLPHGFVTNQLPHYYVAHGKQSVPPPAGASSFRQSCYAVVLSAGGTQHTPERSVPATARTASSVAPHTSNAKLKKTQVAADEADGSTAVALFRDTGHRSNEDDGEVNISPLKEPYQNSFLAAEVPVVTQEEMTMESLTDSDHEV